MRHAAPILMAGLLVVAVSPRAVAEEDASDVKMQCVDAHEKGQLARNAGRLLPARDQFMSCARDACPKLVRDACLQFLQEVEADLPTVIIEARDAQGRDTLDVRMLVDGVRIRERLDAVAIALDPGPHVLRFEMSGADPVEQQVVLHAGEKERRIAIDFPPPTPTAASRRPSQPSRVRESAVATATTDSRTRWPAYVVGGVAAAGLGSFAYFAIAGKSLESERARTCAPTCTDAEVAPVRRDYLVADVSLGAGVIAGAAAAWLLLRGKRTAAASSHARILAGPMRGGAGIAVEGGF